MSTLEQIRANRGTAMDKLRTEAKKMATANYATDDRYWTVDVDKGGNGQAIIRFLPPPNDTAAPWVRIWKHSFKGPSGAYYIENSLTTIGKEDPVGEMNSKLWNISTDDNSPTRKQARDQKRKLTYVSNILVVKDKLHPEHEGKVFLYRFGKKIFDKIMQKMESTFEDDETVNVFDPEVGANLKLKIRTIEGWRNYDLSDFDAPAPIAETDEEMNDILGKCYDLSELIAPNQFKSYVELKTKLARVLGTTVNEDDIALAEKSFDKSDDKDFDKRWSGTATEPKGKTATEPKGKVAASAVSTKSTNSKPAKWDSDDDNDEDYLAKFKKLAED